MPDSKPENGEKVAAHLLIRGRVQGVCFRMEAIAVADRHQVSGWVRNIPDGRVEVYLCGAPAEVEAVLAWCRQGPPAARVDAVEIDWQQPAEAISGFSMRY